MIDVINTQIDSIDSLTKEFKADLISAELQSAEVLDRIAKPTEEDIEQGVKILRSRNNVDSLVLEELNRKGYKFESIEDVKNSSDDSAADSTKVSAKTAAIRLFISFNSKFQESILAWQN